MELKEKAAIGIGVPLGVLLIFMTAGLIYANMAKRRKLARGEVEELEMNKDANANVPPPKVIKWSPWQNY